MIVPWLEIRKNVQLLPINVEATGEGEAGKSGEVLISVANPNDFPVRLASFELKHPRLVGAGDYQIQSQGSALVPTSLQQVELRPLGSRELRATWATWPFEQSETTTEGVLIYHLPSGEERTESCAVSLVTKALYSSTLSLDDLEDF